MKKIPGNVRGLRRALFEGAVVIAKTGVQTALNKDLTETEDLEIDALERVALQAFHVLAVGVAWAVTELSIFALQRDFRVGR